MAHFEEAYDDEERDELTPLVTTSRALRTQHFAELAAEDLRQLKTPKEIDGARFATQYRIWRNGILGGYSSEPTRLPACRASSRGFTGRDTVGRQIGDRSVGSVRSSPAEPGSAKVTAGAALCLLDARRPLPPAVLAEFTHGNPSGPGSQRKQKARSLDTSSRIRMIRASELEDVEYKEQDVPGMPSTQPGFSSAAHLRSDAYWQELLSTPVMITGPCQWIKSAQWQHFVVFGIVANAVLYGMESAEADWIHVQNCILAFALIEILIIVDRRISGVPFTDAEEVNVFVIDGMAVLGCCFGQWGLPVLKYFDFTVTEEQDAFAIQICKMLWLLRFIRIVVAIPSLHELAKGILDALQGLIWVLVFMLLIVYSIGICCTRLIGQSDLSGGPVDDDEEDEEVKKMFANVGTSMFVLFQIMSQWSLTPLFPLFDFRPSVKIWFVLFYVSAGWILLAVMTGVVSFNMIALKATIMADDKARENEHRARAKAVLLDIFNRADEDGSGEVNEEEFQTMLRCHDLMLLLQQHTNIQVTDLLDLWNFLDDDKSGAVSVDEFMIGFQWLNEPFKPSTLLRLQQKLISKMRQQQRKMDRFFSVTFDIFAQKVKPTLQRLGVVAEQIQVLDSTFNAALVRIDDHARALAVEWQQTGRAARPRLSTSSAASDQTLSSSLASMEGKIGLCIDEICRRLDRFEVV